MNEEELKKMKPKDLYRMAADLGVQTGGKKPDQVIKMLLDHLDGKGAEPVVEEGEKELTAEEIIAQEKNLLEDEEGVDLGEGDEVEPEDSEGDPSEFTQEPTKGSYEGLVQPLTHSTARQNYNANKTHGKHWPTPHEVADALKQHVSRGLKIVKLTEDQWHFRIHTREAAGNLKMPLNTIVQQATLLLRPTKKPTEDLSHEEILAVKVAEKQKR